jgi:hypothetical protein
LKEIQLTNLETQKHITVLLNDSKEPQVIDISELKPHADRRRTTGNARDDNSLVRVYWFRVKEE